MRLTKWGKEHYAGRSHGTLCESDIPQRTPKRLGRARRLCVPCAKAYDRANPHRYSPDGTRIPQREAAFDE